MCTYPSCTQPCTLVPQFLSTRSKQWIAASRKLKTHGIVVLRTTTHFQLAFKWCIQGFKQSLKNQNNTCLPLHCIPCLKSPFRRRRQCWQIVGRVYVWTWKVWGTFILFISCQSFHIGRPLKEETRDFLLLTCMNNISMMSYLQKKSFNFVFAYRKNRIFKTQININIKKASK